MIFVAPHAAVAVSWVAAFMSPWCCMGVPLIAHSSLTLVGSTVAWGNAVSFAQLVVAPELTMMYLVATFIAAIRLLGERGWDASSSTAFAGDSFKAKQMLGFPGATPP